MYVLMFVFWKQTLSEDELIQFADALKANTTLESLSMANTRATEKVAKVCFPSSHR